MWLLCFGLASQLRGRRRVAQLQELVLLHEPEPQKVLGTGGVAAPCLLQRARCLGDADLHKVDIAREEAAERALNRARSCVRRHGAARLASSRATRAAHVAWCTREGGTPNASRPRRTVATGLMTQRVDMNKQFIGQEIYSRTSMTQGMSLVCPFIFISDLWSGQGAQGRCEADGRSKRPCSTALAHPWACSSACLSLRPPRLSAGRMLPLPHRCCFHSLCACGRPASQPARAAHAWQSTWPTTRPVRFSGLGCGFARWRMHREQVKSDTDHCLIARVACADSGKSRNSGISCACWTNTPRSWTCNSCASCAWSCAG